MAPLWVLLLSLGLLLPLSAGNPNIPLLFVNTQPRELYLEKIDLPKSYANQARYNLENWEREMGEKIFTRKGTVPITIRMAAIKQTDKKDGLVTLAYARVRSDHCEITFDKKTWGLHQLSFVLLHELGHCYGYDHDKREEQVMSAVYSWSLSEQEESEFLKTLWRRATRTHIEKPERLFFEPRFKDPLVQSR